MTDDSFSSYKDAALMVLHSGENVTRKAASFLGQVCVDDSLTEKQLHWLQCLLKNNSLPPLADDG